jgi:hypothetical protein
MTNDLEARARCERDLQTAGLGYPMGAQAAVWRALDVFAQSIRADAQRETLEMAVRVADEQCNKGLPLGIPAALRAMIATEGEKPAHPLVQEYPLDCGLHELAFPVPPQPAAHEGESADWGAVNVAINEYLDGYEFRGDGGDHAPTDDERELIDDVISGLIADEAFSRALRKAEGTAHEGEMREALAKKIRRVLVDTTEIEFMAMNFYQRVKDRESLANSIADIAIAALAQDGVKP